MNQINTLSILLQLPRIGINPASECNMNYSNCDVYKSNNPK